MRLSCRIFREEIFQLTVRSIISIVPLWGQEEVGLQFSIISGGSGGISLYWLILSIAITLFSSLQKLRIHFDSLLFKFNAVVTANPAKPVDCKHNI